jgi:uncharacterized protein YfaS (alpha-2-macroglobulin family)
LIAISLACSVPFINEPTATPPNPTTIPATATPTPIPLPPDLVESDPLPGAEISLTEPVTLYFNQSMDRSSVEGALSGEPTLSGHIDWIDDATLTFSPDTALLPETSLTININTTAQSTSGMPLIEPISISYNTAGYLQLSQALPEPESFDVDPTSAVVAAFNRPIVPLGADQAALPAAFTIEPDTEGHGEWLNTSTFIFYPDPSLYSGYNYTVRINPDLMSTDGTQLESEYSWSFTTTNPYLISMNPIDGDQGVRLDTGVQLRFNQPMEINSVESNFSLLDPNGQSVPGETFWNEDFTTLSFTPTIQLERDVNYISVLGADARDLGGTSIGYQEQATWSTVPELMITGSDPVQGGTKNVYGGVYIYLSSYIPPEEVTDFIISSPEIPNLRAFVSPEDKSLQLYGDYEPSTAYTMTVSRRLTDEWGSSLGEDFSLNFNTAPLNPSLTFSLSSKVLFLTPRDSGIPAQATNINSVPISLGSVSLNDLITMLGPGGYDLQQTYQPAEAVSWQHELDLEPNRSQVVNIPVTADGSSLPPGLYYMRINVDPSITYDNQLLLVVSNNQITYKISATEALVWAVDLHTNEALVDAPVVVYDETGNTLVSGRTDGEGIFSGSIPIQDVPYANTYAVVGNPGDEVFSMAMSSWNQGLSPYNFGIPVDYRPPHTTAYLYTDRPIYRPGQTVYFRVVVRGTFNGRYKLPDMSSFPVKLYDGFGQELATFDLPLSTFGTGHGSYTLLPDAQPGNYRLGDEDTSIFFQVSEYRKPEINLQVTFDENQILSGQSLVGRINARYFFDAPAGNVPLHWRFYEAPSNFYIPGGYQVGEVDTGWLAAYYYPQGRDPLGALVSEGEGITESDGTLTLELPTEASASRRRYTLEVTLTDESGLPVSARDSAQANPATFYIGVRPDSWVSRAGNESGYQVLVVDWEGEPAGERTLQARFQKVVYVRIDPDPEEPYRVPEFVPEYTLIASTDFSTGEDGSARLAFIPPEPGTYQLDVSGGGAVTQVLQWVAGDRQAIWPNVPNQRLRLTADQDIYQPGDTAQVFIPNPLNGEASALVTIERGSVMEHEIIQISPGGRNLSIPLDENEAPNVYVAVTLLGQNEEGRPDFRQGYIALHVEPVQFELDVTLTSQPERASPGDRVTFGIQVTDKVGNPVQGEFSLSVVDLAALVLADPNSEDILSAFYGEQGLGVRTSLSLAAYAWRRTFLPGGLGGGGGDLAGQVVREDFPDTAYWNAEIVTDANGEATVSINLPDSLTTWQVDTRGVTADTQVGEAMTNVITSKPLLVRPVTPRFLVVDDHTQLAVIVQNNTNNDLQTDVSLQTTGFQLDDPNASIQQVLVPANGRVRLAWWGTTQDVPSIDLVFSAQSGELSDAARPSLGELPVLRYTAPQTFATSGVLSEGGERLELISLPVSFDPQGGELNLELAPSLAASMLNTLDVLEHYPYECNEQTLSRFLPNLETYRTLQEFGVDSAELETRVERTLQDGLQLLLSRQNPDGGWGWWPGGDSDAYISAYVLFGLIRTQEAGVYVPEGAIEKAVEYLYAGLFTPEMTNEQWQLDRLAFIHYALSQAGAGHSPGANALYDVRHRLNSWAQALLALTLEEIDPGNDRTHTLISDLQSTAIRSSTGVHWENTYPSFYNLSSTNTASAMVVYALSQLEPASTLLPDAVRYLMSNRQANGSWASTYESAWVILSATEYMKGTGELSGDFSFDATLNGTPYASGDAGGDTMLNPVVATTAVDNLYPDDPNGLLIKRDSGPGRLYYNTALNVSRPVETVAALNSGINLQRAYYLPRDSQSAEDLGAPDELTPIQSAHIGDLVSVHLTLVLPNDGYNLLIEDYIPAGTEILNTSLKTSQQGGYEEFVEPEPLYSSRRPFREGWGWWYFHTPQIYDDHIAWSADYLPAGTYELTYTLVIVQPGEYHVLPARAWQFYFPEVQGNSEGMIFEVKP